MVKIKKLFYKIKNKIQQTKNWILFVKVKPRGGPQSDSYKKHTIIDTAQKHNIKTFVETGTYIGETVKAAIPYFDKIYSIEIDRRLYNYCKNKFKRNKNVKIILGDSPKKLEDILPKVKEKTLFWLDAHYSGGITSQGDEETPIEKELNIIFKNWIPRSIILIDDARLFGKNGYPSLKTIKNLAYSHNLKSKVHNDIIKIGN